MCPDDRYADLVEDIDVDFVFEERAEYMVHGRWTERHLQCVWYNESLRPDGLVTDGGEAVEVESPGRWNLEAGPDFIDAVLLIGPERRRVVGDVEVHLRPSGWTSHGHAGDPRYANVVAHVTYFPGPRTTDLPERAVAIPMREAIRSRRGFSFDDIDVSAYPHAMLPSTPRPCQTAWGDDPDRAAAMLEAAGLHRFDIKRRRMRDAITDCGDPIQAFFQAAMGALGYKQNSQNFRSLARMFPLAEWGDDVFDNYAVLLGLGDLIPDPSTTSANAGFVRDLWDRWWRSPLKGRAEPPKWRLDSVRPLNHPVRRLAAAAALFTDRERLSAFLDALDPSRSKFVREVCKAISSMASFPEMEPLTSLSRKAGKPCALIGPAAASAITTNVVLPYLGAIRPDAREVLCKGIPSETISAPMRTMANRLFGRDHNPSALYASSGLRQQGLLQIFADFCLSAKSGCDYCAMGRIRGGNREQGRGNGEEGTRNKE